MRAAFEKDGLLIVDEDKPVFFYRIQSLDPAKPSRFHYIHPLYAPDGTVLTEDAPPDHVHHRGIFWAWRRILERGQVIADSWTMQDLTFRLEHVQFEREGDTGVVRTWIDWLEPDRSERHLFSEGALIRVHPLSARGVRQLDFDIILVARQPGLALAGSDDDKGYGGFSLRLVDSEKLTFDSNGTIHPEHGAITLQHPLTFAWEQGGPPVTVTASCRANDAPVNEWILRKGGSMQNAAFPGRTPVEIPFQMILHLSAQIVIAPRA